MDAKPHYVIFDLDGVLADFRLAYIWHINTLWPGRFSEDFQPQAWEGFGLTPQELLEVWKHITETENFWETLPPYSSNCQELRDALATTAMTGTEIYFVTSRSPVRGRSTKKQSEEWLRLNVSSDVFEKHNSNVIVSPSAIAKSQLYKLLFSKPHSGSLHPYPYPIESSTVQPHPLAVSLEDHIPTVLACQDIPGHKPFLMERSWNVLGVVPGITLQRAISVQDFLSKSGLLSE